MWAAQLRHRHYPLPALAVALLSAAAWSPLHVRSCCSLLLPTSHPAQQQRMIEDLRAEGGEEAAPRNVKALIRTLTFERIQAKNAEGGAGAQVRGG